MSLACDYYSVTRYLSPLQLIPRSTLPDYLGWLERAVSGLQKPIYNSINFYAFICYLVYLFFLFVWQQCDLFYLFENIIRAYLSKSRYF